MSNNSSTQMHQDFLSETKLNPVIAALEKADASAAIIYGFLGTSNNEVVKLYDSLDVSSYVEIPKEALIHIEADESGDTGALRAYVRGSCEILSVQRNRIRASDWNQRVGPQVFRQFPPLQPTDECFYLCTAEPERKFAEEMDNINRDPNLPVSARLFRREQAVNILRSEITQCATKFGAPLVIGGADTVIRGIMERHSLT